MSVTTDDMIVSRSWYERVTRVLQAAKKADQAEREAMLDRTNNRTVKLALAFGDRIAMGEALDALEPGDVE